MLQRKFVTSELQKKKAEFSAPTTATGHSYFETEGGWFIEALYLI